MPALLFSLCDDGEKTPETTKVTVTGNEVTLEGTGTIESDETFTVTTAPTGIEATEVSIKVSYDGSNYTVEGSFNVPKDTDLSDRTELKWDSLGDVFTDTKKVTGLTLKGSYADGTFTVTEGSYTAADIPKGTVTIPYDKIGSTLKDAASDATATVNWGTDSSTFDGEGTWETPASDPITLNDVPTNTESIYVKVVLTGTNDGTYKSEEISIDFAGDTTATVSSEVNFTKEEPVTLTLSGSPTSITGNNIQDNDVITITTNPTTGLENATSTNVTIKKTSGSWTVSGEIKLPAGETFTSESLSWTGLEVTASTSSAKVTAVTLSGEAGGSGNALTFDVTGGEITATPGGDV